MVEHYPDDATLLTLEADDATGVEYIATGKSPYHLQFRRMLYRLLRAAERANDLRIYQDGNLTIGVRPGWVYINQTAVSFAGSSGIALSASDTHSVWLDATGTIQTATSGFPSDRTTFVPLAVVTTGSSTIQSVVDRRGETFLQVPSLGMLGLSASANEIDQVLDGVEANVTASALNTLTGGWASVADGWHRHETFDHDLAGEAELLLRNSGTDAAANMVLKWRLPFHLPYDAELLMNTDTGFLKQRYNGQSYDLVGTVHRQLLHEGTLISSVSGRLVGAVPIDGKVSDVILSVGTNIESSDSGDGLSATARVNGDALTTGDPALTAAAGSAFRCTDQGDGTAATVKSDGTEMVTRGDVLTVDLTRTVNGSVSTELADVVVLVVLRPNRPE
jgi:hypothetical protein